MTRPEDRYRLAYGELLGWLEAVALETRDYDLRISVSAACRRVADLREERAHPLIPQALRGLARDLEAMARRGRRGTRTELARCADYARGMVARYHQVQQR